MRHHVDGFWGAPATAIASAQNMWSRWASGRRQEGMQIVTRMR